MQQTFSYSPPTDVEINISLYERIQRSLELDEGNVNLAFNPISLWSRVLNKNYQVRLTWAQFNTLKATCNSLKTLYNNATDLLINDPDDSKVYAYLLDAEERINILLNSLKILK